MMKSQGVVSEDGSKIYSWGIWNKIETLSWQSHEDLEKLANERDPVEAPYCHYKIQPENQGKLVWISGPPGKVSYSLDSITNSENASSELHDFFNQSDYF